MDGNTGSECGKTKNTSYPRLMRRLAGDSRRLAKFCGFSLHLQVMWRLDVTPTDCDFWAGQMMACAHSRHLEAAAAFTVGLGTSHAQFVTTGSSEAIPVGSSCGCDGGLHDVGS